MKKPKKVKETTIIDLTGLDFFSGTIGLLTITNISSGFAFASILFLFSSRIKL